jgi:DNA-binding MarR family transcriptional regulator
MSMLLPQMEKRGLIERRADRRDKRILRLFLTEDGRDLTTRAMVIQTDLIERTLSVTPIEDCMMMATHMEKLIARLQSEEAAED